MGSSTSANVHVAGVNDSSNDMLNLITLLATKDTMLVVFDTSASSFNKGLTIQVVGGVVFSESVTTMNYQEHGSIG